MAEGWPVVQQRRSALFVLSSANRIGNAIGHNSFADSYALRANGRFIIQFVRAQFIFACAAARRAERFLTQEHRALANRSWRLGERFVSPCRDLSPCGPCSNEPGFKRARPAQSGCSKSRFRAACSPLIVEAFHAPPRGGNPLSIEIASFVALSRGQVGERGETVRRRLRHQPELTHFAV